MTTSSRVRTAGMIGMAGGVLWIISVIMQHSLGLFESDGSPVWIIHQVIALAGMICSMAGFLGLLWGQAFRGRLGPVGVLMHILGWGLIAIGGFALLVTGPAESPLFLVFPIGGMLHDLGYVLDWHCHHHQRALERLAALGSTGCCCGHYTNYGLAYAAGCDTRWPWHDP